MGEEGGGGGVLDNFWARNLSVLIILKIEAIASDARNCSFGKKPGVTIVKRSNLDHHVLQHRFRDSSKITGCRKKILIIN